MSPHAFEACVAEGYTHVPVMREVLADLETPLGAYLKLANSPHSYFLESVQGGEKWGRYSIIGLPCRRRLTVTGRTVTLWCDAAVESQQTVDDPLAFIQQWRQSFRVPDLPGLPRFRGGLVGYFGYDIVRYIEKRLDRPEKSDALGTPDILLMLSEDIAVFDNLRGTLLMICHADTAQAGSYEAATARLDAIEARLRAPGVMPAAEPRREISEAEFVSGFGQGPFEQAVEGIKEYVRAGDIMQVVLSQRMTLPYAHSPLGLYRALRSLNPSPYMYFFNLDGFHIVGSSPEILARLDHGTVTVRPIAGTRRRGQTIEEDQQLEQDLLADPKEIAEHLMLIDLGRNDVGRIAETGSVRLTDKMVVERYSHVMHIVSNVEGRLLPGRDAIDVLRAVFPAGTLSGAPKIRAMEIIDDLEPVKRGIYGGAVGYIDWNGDMDTAIAIRTAIVKDGQLHIQAGAGVVADSQPVLEWEETCNKARAIFRAAAMAAGGLEPPGR